MVTQLSYNHLSLIRTELTGNPSNDKTTPVCSLASVEAGRGHLVTNGVQGVEGPGRLHEETTIEIPAFAQAESSAGEQISWPLGIRPWRLWSPRVVYEKWGRLQAFLIVLYTNFEADWFFKVGIFNVGSRTGHIGNGNTFSIFED